MVSAVCASSVWLAIHAPSAFLLGRLGGIDCGVEIAYLSLDQRLSIRPQLSDPCRGILSLQKSKPLDLISGLILATTERSANLHMQHY
jgi:hypothetical protein